MKKLLTLIFVTLFLFTSCKEETKPKEVETPVDVEENTEVQTPTVEMPKTEVLEPTEVEEIILPEPDENTKVIEISFPEDFPEEPYTEPELVSPEEFEWGDYVPFVRYQDKRYGRYLYTYKYAFLTQDTPTLDEAYALYAKFNDKYAISYPEKQGDLGICGDIFLEENKDIRDYLFKSRIIFLSEDLDKFGRFSLIYADEDNGGDLAHKKWNSKYELIENEEIVRTNEISEAEDLSDSMYHSYKNLYFYNLTYGERIVFINDEVIISEGTDNTYHLYSISENKLISEFKLVKKNKTIFSVKQIVDNRYLLLYCASIHSTEAEPLIDFYSAHYLYDLTTNEMTFLTQFSEESALLSPDGKYFIYTAPTEKSQIISQNNRLENMKNGYYIKNLSDNKTTFFEGSDESELHIGSWINKDKLLEEIEQ